MRSAGNDSHAPDHSSRVAVLEVMKPMDTSRGAIEQWLLLDGCRLPPRVFVIIDELLKVIERQDQVLTASQSERYEDHEHE